MSKNIPAESSSAMARNALGSRRTPKKKLSWPISASPVALGVTAR